MAKKLIRKWLIAHTLGTTSFSLLLTNYDTVNRFYILISGMQPQQCLFCGHMVQLVHVHGHYQCPVCNTNALPCCDGDNCNTNQLLAVQTTEHTHTNDNVSLH